MKNTTIEKLRAIRFNKRVKEVMRKSMINLDVNYKTNKSRLMRNAWAISSACVNCFNMTFAECLKMAWHIEWLMKWESKNNMSKENIKGLKDYVYHIKRRLESCERAILSHIVNTAENGNGINDFHGEWDTQLSRDFCYTRNIFN